MQDTRYLVLIDKRRNTEKKREKRSKGILQKVQREKKERKKEKIQKEREKERERNKRRTTMKIRIGDDDQRFMFWTLTLVYVGWCNGGNHGDAVHVEAASLDRNCRCACAEIYK